MGNQNRLGMHRHPSSVESLGNGKQDSPRGGAEASDLSTHGGGRGVKLSISWGFADAQGQREAGSYLLFQLNSMRTMPVTPVWFFTLSTGARPHRRVVSDNHFFAVRSITITIASLPPFVSAGRSPPGWPRMSVSL